jgi:AGZA family xanthine/uracil permease-like MFS transporter
LAFLIGIFAVTILGKTLDLVPSPEQWWSKPDFRSVLLQVDPLSALKIALFPAIVSVFFTDLFDSISTFIGIAHTSGLKNENGDPKNLKEGLIVDALATLGAGLLGTSSGTAFIESTAGIKMGGRTGLTSIVTALCFLPCLFLAPLAGMVPPFATAPVLILIGALMFKSVSELKLEHLEDALPAYLTVILIPLTYSITQGILWGFVSHSALYALAGRRKEISPLLWGITLCSVLLLAIEHFPPLKG